MVAVDEVKRQESVKCQQCKNYKVRLRGWQDVYHNHASIMSHQKYHIKNVTSKMSHQKCHIKNVTTKMSHQNCHIKNVTSCVNQESCERN